MATRIKPFPTPVPNSSGVPPLELLFNRIVKGKLNVLQKRNIINKHKRASANEIIKQQYNKQYADNRRNANTSDIKVGDQILVRQSRQNKLTPRFNTTRYTVTERNKSRVTARNWNGHTITRNVSHFKPISMQHEMDTDTDDDERKTNNHQGQNADGHNQLPAAPARRSGRERRQPERYGQPLSWTLCT